MDINTSSIETYWGEVYTNCLHVHSESMPAARIEVNSDYVKQLVKLIESFGLKHREFECKDQKDKTRIWIYKYYHLGEIIEILNPGFSSVKTTDILHIWMAGKLLGMSEKAIEEYILSIGE